MDSIEKMRNAVAHNRRPSKKATSDYLNALPLVNQALDDYLSTLSADWRDSLDDVEMHWDTAAREAVESAIEAAHWEGEDKTITLHDPNEPRMRTTVRSRDELMNYLENVASSAFYANAPREDGEFVFECDEYGVVEGVLAEYEDRLAEFFDTEE